MSTLSLIQRTLLDMYINRATTRIGINYNNLKGDKISIYAVCDIKAGDYVCNLPSKDIFDAGGTIDLTPSELCHVNNPDALLTIAKRTAPQLNHGEVESFPIPTRGMNELSQEYYLRHATSARSRHNLVYVDSDNVSEDGIQSEEFASLKAACDIKAGEELIIEYDRPTKDALDAGERCIRNLVRSLRKGRNNAQDSSTPFSELSEGKKNIINHLNNHITVQLRPSELNTKDLQIGVGVYVMESGARLLKRGMNPFALPDGIEEMKTVQFTHEELFNYLSGREDTVQLMLMIGRMLSPSVDKETNELIYELPVGGPNSMGLSYLFNTVVGLNEDKYEASLEPEELNEDDEQLSRMLLIKDSVEEGKELLGNYPLDIYYDDRDPCELDDEFKADFYEAVLALTPCEKDEVLVSADSDSNSNSDSDSDSDSNSNSESKLEYDNESLLRELESATYGSDLPKDMAGKIIYEKMKEDGEDVDSFETDQLSLCVLLLFGEDADETDINILEDAIIDAINKSDSSDDEDDDEEEDEEDDEDVELFDVVDNLFREVADKDTVTVKDINRSVAAHFSIPKVEEEMKKKIKARLTDLVQGDVILSDGEEENEEEEDDDDKEEYNEEDDKQPKRKRSSRKKTTSKKKKKKSRGQEPTTKDVRLDTIGTLMGGEDGPFQGMVSDGKGGCVFDKDMPSPKKRTTTSTSERRVTKSWNRLTRKEKKRARGYAGRFGLNYIVREGGKRDKGNIIGKYHGIETLNKGLGISRRYFNESDVTTSKIGYEHKRSTGTVTIFLYNEQKDGKWEDIENNEVKLNSYKLPQGGNNKKGPYLVYPSNESDGKALLRKCKDATELKKALKDGGVGELYQGERIYKVKWNKGRDNTEYFIWKTVFRIETCTIDRYNKNENLDETTLRKICAREKNNDAHFEGHRARNKRVARDSWNLPPPNPEQQQKVVIREEKKRKREAEQQAKDERKRRREEASAAKRGEEAPAPPNPEQQQKNDSTAAAGDVVGNQSGKQSSNTEQQEKKDNSAAVTNVVVGNQKCAGCSCNKSKSYDSFTQSQLRNRKRFARCKECVSANIPAKGVCNDCSTSKESGCFRKEMYKETNPRCKDCCKKKS